VLIAKFPVQQPLYFYSLDGTWPRAFVGQKLTISKYSYREPEFYNEISRNPWLALHVSAEDAEIVNNAWPVDYHLTSSDSPNVKSVSEASDGFTLELSNASGGTVAVNLPFTSLWSASCGGSPTTLVPVNGVQMAAFVPKGCTSLRFVYSP